MHFKVVNGKKCNSATYFLHGVCPVFCSNTLMRWFCASYAIAARVFLPVLWSYWTVRPSHCRGATHDSFGRPSELVPTAHTHTTNRYTKLVGILVTERRIKQENVWYSRLQGESKSVSADALTASSQAGAPCKARGTRNSQSDWSNKCIYLKINKGTNIH